MSFPGFYPCAIGKQVIKMGLEAIPSAKLSSPTKKIYFLGGVISILLVRQCLI
jgi:hypothetical protein